MSPEQERSFGRVLAGLDGIGYSGDLLQPDYRFGDWLLASTPDRTVEAAAFGRTPASPESACFAVFTSNGKPGIARVRECRALGAPRAFEIDPQGRVYHWRVGVRPEPTDRQAELPQARIKAVIQEHASDWSPDAMMRAKNIGPVRPRQADFIDLGLFPAIEQSVREKLDPLLRTVLKAAQDEYISRTGKKPSPTALFQLLFRVLTGKIMHDRGVPGFGAGKAPPAADAFLAKVAAHYNEPGPVAIEDSDVRQLVVDGLWAGVNLKHISVDTLAFVWENTLLTDSDRRSRSIHATPPSIARYIARRLIPEDAVGLKKVVEPCCGAATFLIAAMQRLRELLPNSMSGLERHRHFKEVLFGFDTEPFGLEVAKCRLMLADFPYPNRWHVYQEDVFADETTSPAFHSAISSADVVLCNPPFGSFSAVERSRYGVASPFKQVELLSRILRDLPPHGRLGFVMPLQALSGRGYKAVREQLVERFDEIEVVSLPDKVFEKAEQETALLIAQGDRPVWSGVHVTHRKVDDGDWPNFRDFYQVSGEAVASVAPEDAVVSFALPDLSNVWGHLVGLPRLRDTAALIRRGIEWNIPLDENRSLLVRPVKSDGYERGIPSAPKGAFVAYQPPPVAFLSLKPEYHRRAFDLPWHLPKVVVSAKRRSRSPWRVAAFADRSGLVCYQSYTCVWPTAGWEPEVLAAVLNSPVANAYIAAHEGNRDITNETIADIPVPSLSRKTSAVVKSLVGEYSELVSKWRLEAPGREAAASRLLLQLDAVILKAYGLPQPLERDLVEYFDGSRADRPVSVRVQSYTLDDLNRAYEEVSHSLESSEKEGERTWNQLTRSLDENRSSKRKLFQ